WDLEAPGLERFFPNIVKTALDHSGVIDMLLDYKAKMSDVAPIGQDEDIALPYMTPTDAVVEIYPHQEKSGWLALISAGRRAGAHFDNYAYAVRTFDWHDFYQRWEGEIYFEWLREQFQKLADVVLIDSRTGVTEISGISVYQFADTVIMF